MSDVVTEVTRTGFLGNLKNAVVGVLVGLVMFAASFPVLYWNEGRVNLAAVAKTSLPAPADKPDAALEGKFVSVSAAVQSKEEIGDPEFLRAGPWIRLDRKVEMFAWKEKKDTKEEKELGGGTKKTTTYTYTKEWVHDPKPSSEFHSPAGHENPPLALPAATFKVKRAELGGYGLDASACELPSGGPLTVTSALLDGASVSGRGAKLDGSYVFFGVGSVANPTVGDVRVSFLALERGALVTLFGKQTADQIGPHVFSENESPFFRALKGTREEAIAELAFEDAVIRWLLRGLGFILMWFGMSLVLGPISAVMDVIPALGGVSRFLIGVILFPIALVLTTVTIVISLIFHSLVATVIAVVVVAIALFVIFGRKKKPAAAAA